ncbi:MAG: NAD(P)H-dependent oxidoreductase [Pseudomonadota bacterium]
MARALVVSAHPDPASFTAQWAAASAAALAADYEVTRTDLYASGFDPAERAALYTDPPHPFDALKAQAAETSPDVAHHMADVLAAELLVLHFPLWWFAPPAMIKGWYERVLRHGAVHDTGTRFDTGRKRGGRALFCVTTGADEGESARDGKEGHTRLLLMPLAYTLRYCGFEVYEPLTLHGVHGYHRGARAEALTAKLNRTLDAQAGALATLAQRPLLPFNADTDFDPSGRLRPDAVSHHPFIRHD